jgi:flagellar protein FlgJ
MINTVNSTYEMPASLSSIYRAAAIDISFGNGVTLDTPAEAQANKLISNDNTAARHQLVQAGRQFEAYFISYLLKVMRETVPQGAIANKPGAYFHSFYDQEIGIRAAESGGIGFTRMVQEHAEKYFSPPPVRPQVLPVENR